MNALADPALVERMADQLPPAEELDRALGGVSPAEVIAAALRTVGREHLAVVSSFGTDAALGDTAELAGKWGEYLLASRATTIYGGTSEVQLNIIAERLLGLPRDP